MVFGAQHTEYAHARRKCSHARIETLSFLCRNVAILADRCGVVERQPVVESTKPASGSTSLETTQTLLQASADRELRPVAEASRGLGRELVEDDGEIALVGVSDLVRD